MASKSKFAIVTGEIGAGKSTVCNHLSSLGYRVVKSDDVAKKELYNWPKVRHKLAEEFGNDVINSDNTLDIRKIKKRLFDENYHKAYIRFETYLTDCFAEYLLDNENGDLVFVEIPPLEPSINLAKRLNICNTFFIPVEKDEQSKRLRHRGMTSAEVFERLVLQSEEFVKNLPGYVKLTGKSQNYGEPYQRFAAEIIDHIQRGK